MTIDLEKLKDLDRKAMQRVASSEALHEREAAANECLNVFADLIRELETAMADSSRFREALKKIDGQSLQSESQYIARAALGVPGDKP